MIMWNGVNIDANYYQMQYEAYITMANLGYTWNQSNNSFYGDHCGSKCTDNQGRLLDKFDSSVMCLRLDGFYWNGLNWVYR